LGTQAAISWFKDQKMLPMTKSIFVLRARPAKDDNGACLEISHTTEQASLFVAKYVAQPTDHDAVFFEVVRFDMFWRVISRAKYALEYLQFTTQQFTQLVLFGMLAVPMHACKTSLFSCFHPGARYLSYLVTAHLFGSALTEPVALHIAAPVKPNDEQSAIMALEFCQPFPPVVKCQGTICQEIDASWFHRAWVLLEVFWFLVFFFPLAQVLKLKKSSAFVLSYFTAASRLGKMWDRLPARVKARVLKVPLFIWSYIPASIRICLWQVFRQASSKVATLPRRIGPFFFGQTLQDPRLPDSSIRRSATL
jgi:hypothetical protein